MAAAVDDGRRQRLLSAIGEAYKGRKLERVPKSLRAEIAKVSGNVPLKLRLGVGGAQDIKAGIQLAEDETAGKKDRTEIIEALESTPQAMEALLRVAITARSHAVRKAALQSLQSFDEPRIARDLLAAYPQLPKEEGVRTRAVDLLTRRPEWSRQLLAAIEAGTLKRDEVPFDAV